MKKLIEIMDPKVDSVFKKIFGEKDYLFIDFVNSVFADKNEKLVKSVTFLNNEFPKDISGGKECRLDVRAVLDDGSHINIEVQMSPQKFYVQRSLFYWAKLFTGQLELGDSYKKLQRSVSINVLNFDLFEKKKKYHTVMAALDLDDHDWIGPEFEVHFLEVPKMPKVLYDKMTKLDKWMRFLQAPNKQVIEELAMKEPIFASARDTLYFLSQNATERFEYEQRLKYLLDKNTEIEEAKSEERLNIAKSLKKSGVSITAIMQATGFSKEEIDKIL